MSGYNIIIAGSRDYTPSDDEIEDAVREWLGWPSEYKLNAVVCGMAKGVDLAGKKWAERRSIDVIGCPADWSRGKIAGKERNWRMAQEESADGLIAFWDGMSPGTAHMIAVATFEGSSIVVRPTNPK